MTKQGSPFAGLQLTSQTPLVRRGTDQQLFAPAASPNPAPVKQPTNLPRKEGSQEPRKVGTQMPGNPGASGRSESSSEGQPLFAITDPATEKNSYMFSEDELWALRDVESELEQTYRTEVSKYNIVRLGLHFLLEDYQRDKRHSFLVRRLGLKSK